jgi:signal transduction histidine kinase
MDSKTRILIVEDESVVGFDLKRILMGLNYEVIDVIRSGEEAFVKAFENKPDLILMDIMLNGNMNGIEAAEQIKNSINVPIIYLTAYADSNTLQSAKVTEPFGYILKPFEEKTLLTTIEMALYKFKMETKIKESERRYKLLAEKLKESNEMKDKFFSIISHNLRSPFDSILGFTEILKNEYKDLKDEERDLYINSLYDSSRHFYHILDNLLQYSRFQAGKMEFKPEELNLKEIIKRNVSVLKNNADKKQIKLANEVDTDVKVFADENMLNSILLNIITNSIKFTEKGGSINITSNIDDKNIELTVTDSGIGMDDEVMINLFRLDSTKSTPGTDNETGTGLGLLLTKEYIERNGGEIRLTSKPKEGTSFTFTLPILD